MELDMNDMTMEFLLTLSIIANFLMAGAITWFRLQLNGHAQHIGELYDALERNGT
jgi:hypothetical protein